MNDIFSQAAQALRDSKPELAAALESIALQKPIGYVLKGREWPNQCYYPESHKPTDIANWRAVYAAPIAIPIVASEPCALNVDELAQELRRIDGNHDLGAGKLAEALMPFLHRHVVISNASGPAASVASVAPALALHVINTARDAMNASTEGGEGNIEIPSHLAAALSLALDEHDAAHKITGVSV